ncbi:DUF3592 domain-containing protein [Xanthomonas pisi]|uniref:DUF3592 domain-containing protein n=1 Tax=Xanthomonas pisi TaxID=56457 RepID=A0A2S7D2I2_9XANT|nr:DUF3592 domain-containing protein [Xanthomonas pisi]KLD70588.1 hypothetical protein Y887_10880 [Xanthomonas pisi DSM 18956]PPU68055.1 DUF3592 domain-containing protein [Xanthomonas pisi]
MGTYFAAIGMICVVLAAWLGIRRLHVVWSGAMASGTVRGHETRESDGAVFHLPAVSFTDAAGRTHRFTSAACGWGRRLPVGTRVTVRYLPSNPAMAYVAGFLSTWAAALALLVLGVAGVVAAWRYRARSRCGLTPLGLFRRVH